MNPPSVAIVVSSCDFFKDCWAPFLASVERWWPTRPWPMYIISNHDAIETPEGISFIRVGEDKQFSSNLKKALAEIEADYIIYLQEDYWLTAPVQNESMQRHLTFCQEYDVDYLRLTFPFLKGTPMADMYYTRDVRLRSSLCLQAAIWKVSTLRKLLRENDTGWDFEYAIRDYAYRTGIKVLSVGLKEAYRSQGINYVAGTGVRKGKWTRAGYRFLQENGFDDLLIRRSCEGRFYTAMVEIQGPLRLPCRAIGKLMLRWNLNF